MTYEGIFLHKHATTCSLFSIRVYLYTCSVHSYIISKKAVKKSNKKTGVKKKK